MKQDRHLRLSTELTDTVQASVGSAASTVAEAVDDAVTALAKKGLRARKAARSAAKSAAKQARAETAKRRRSVLRAAEKKQRKAGKQLKQAMADIESVKREHGKTKGVKRKLLGLLVVGGAAVAAGRALARLRHR